MMVNSGSGWTSLGDIVVDPVAHTVSGKTTALGALSGSMVTQGRHARRRSVAERRAGRTAGRSRRCCAPTPGSRFAGGDDHRRQLGLGQPHAGQRQREQPEARRAAAREPRADRCGHDGARAAGDHATDGALALPLADHGTERDARRRDDRYRVDRQPRRAVHLHECQSRRRDGEDGRCHSRRPAQSRHGERPGEPEDRSQADVGLRGAQEDLRDLAG